MRPIRRLSVRYTTSLRTWLIPGNRESIHIEHFERYNKNNKIKDRGTAVYPGPQSHKRHQMAKWDGFSLSENLRSHDSNVIVSILFPFGGRAARSLLPDADGITRAHDKFQGHYFSMFPKNFFAR